MSLRSLALKRVFLGVSISIVATTSQAQTYSWFHPGGSVGDWSNPSEWSGPGGTPTTGSDVYLSSYVNNNNDTVNAEIGLSLDSLTSQYTNLNLTGTILTPASLTTTTLYAALSSFTLTNASLNVTGSLDAGDYNFHGGDTFYVDGHSFLNVNDGVFGRYVNYTLNGIPEGPNSVLTNYGTSTFTSSSSSPTQFNFSTLNNYGTLNADYLQLDADGAISNSGSLTATGSLQIDGTENGVSTYGTNLTNSGSLVSGGPLTLNGYVVFNTSGVGASATLNSVQLSGAFNDGSFNDTLEATNGGVVAVGSTLTPTAFFENGLFTNAIVNGDTGGLVTVDGTGSKITINANAVDNSVNQSWYAQQYNATLSATNGGNLTINAQTIEDSVTNAGQEHDNFNDIIPSNAIIYADGANSVVNLNATTSVNLDRIVLPDNHPPSTYNYYEAPAPTPELGASGGGTLNINTPTLNLNGSVYSVGTGSKVNVLATTIYDGGGFTSGVNGAINVGTALNPVTLIQDTVAYAGFTAWNLDPTNVLHTVGPSTINIYATNYNGLAPGAIQIDDALASYYGSTLTLTGSTYVGGSIYAQPNNFTSFMPSSVVTINESTSAGGLGIIQNDAGQVTVTAPNIHFSNADFEVTAGTTSLNASTGIILDESSPYALPSYQIPRELNAAYGVLAFQSPSISVSNLALTSTGNNGAVEFDPLAEGNTITFSNLSDFAYYAAFPGSATQGGTVSAWAAHVSTDSGSALQAGGFPGFGSYSFNTAYVLLNNFDASGLDVQNSGTLASANTGALVIGGSSFENQASGVFTVGASSNTYLGYSGSAAPIQDLTQLSTTNSGTVNVYGSLLANGNILSTGTFNVIDSGTDVADLPPYDGNPTGPFPYQVANAELKAGDLTTSGSLTVKGGNLTLDAGSLHNSGSVTISDDLSAPQIYGYGTLNSTLTTSGDFLSTAGAISVVGSTLNVGGTLSTGGSFTISDDGTGGTAFGNAYMDQPGFLTAGSLGSTGTFTATESTLTISSGDLTNSGAFTVQPDDTLAMPTGSRIDVPNGAFNNSGNFSLTGSTLAVGDGATPLAGVSFTNSGPLTVNTDYTAFNAGLGASPNVASINVVSGDVQNGSGGFITLNGTSFTTNGNFNNSGTGAVAVSDVLPAPLGLPIPQGQLVVAGDLNIPGGMVSVTGSLLSVGGNTSVGATGSSVVAGLTISDDALGNPSSFTLPNGSLTVSGMGAFNSVESTIQLPASVTVQDSGTFTAQDDSTLATPMGSSVTVTNSFVNKDSAQVAVTSSTLTINNNLFDPYGLTNSGSAKFSVGNDDTAYIASGYTTPPVQGTVIVSNGDVQNTGSSQINVVGGAFTAYNNLVNSGNSSINVSNEANGYYPAMVSVDGTVTNGTSQSDAAKVTVGDGTYVYAGGGFNQTGVSSKLRVDGYLYGSGYPVNLGAPGDPALSAGFLGGHGTVAMSVNNYAGTVNPGDPQTLTIYGDYTQGPNGTLQLNIDNVGGTIENDMVDVYGNVSLDGTFDLILGPGVSPSQFSTLNLLTILGGGTATGHFTTLEETYPFGGEGHTITVPLPGTLNYGPGGFSYTPQAVPEPSSFVALGGAALLILRRKKKRSPLE